MRVALGDAAPLYRDAPEAQEAKASGRLIVETFMQEALPQASDAVRSLTANLIETTLTQAGKHFSETLRTAQEIEDYGAAMADMFCAYITRVGRRRQALARA